jgi:hypothetical protein
LYLARRGLAEMQLGQIGLWQHGVVNMPGLGDLLLEGRRGGREEEHAKQRPAEPLTLGFILDNTSGYGEGKKVTAGQVDGKSSQWSVGGAS